LSYAGVGSAPPVVADAYETNNSLGSAKNLGTVEDKTYSGLTFHTDSDVDYFAFTTPTKASQYKVATTNNEQTVKVEIYSSSGSLLDQGNNSVTFSVSKKTTYKVKLSSPSGVHDDYRLVFDKVK